MSSTLDERRLPHRVPIGEAQFFMRDKNSGTDFSAIAVRTDVIPGAFKTPSKCDETRQTARTSGTGRLRNAPMASGKLGSRLAPDQKRGASVRRPNCIAYEVRDLRTKFAHVWSSAPRFFEPKSGLASAARSSPSLLGDHAAANTVC